MANRLVSYIRDRAKNRQSVAASKNSGFVAPVGLPYYAFLGHIHERYLLDWYMEIGCRTGTIFQMSRAKTIAVDPFFQVKNNVIGQKEALHVFQTKSDDFFASQFLERNNVRLSMSFLDGMHLFEYLLRDFIGAERNSHPEGFIAMHDCCPTDYSMTTRDLGALPRHCWTGDVWKLIPILQRYRPDLKVTVLNCSATGLVLVSNLAPQNDVLSKNYDEIISAYAGLDLQTFGADAFYASFEFMDAQRFLDESGSLFERVALDTNRAFMPVKISP